MLLCKSYLVLCNYKQLHGVSKVRVWQLLCGGYKESIKYWVIMYILGSPRRQDIFNSSGELQSRLWSRYPSIFFLTIEVGWSLYWSKNPKGRETKVHIDFNSRQYFMLIREKLLYFFSPAPCLTKQLTQIVTTRCWVVYVEVTVHHYTQSQVQKILEIPVYFI